jgi:hypothetical protein
MRKNDRDPEIFSQKKEILTENLLWHFIWIFGSKMNY